MDTNTIENISDNDLYQIIWEKGYAKSNTKTNNLPKTKSNYIAFFFAIHMLEAEIYNGGFDQFFENQGLNEYCEDALNGLKIINAIEFENLLIEAIEIHRNEDEKLIGRNPEYDELDHKFCNLNESIEEEWTKLNRLQINYIRKYPSLYVN